MNNPVTDLMRPCRSAVKKEATLAEAAMAMLNESSRELPVVDGDGRLVGIVFAEDLFGVHRDTIEPIVRPARLVIPSDASSAEAVQIMEKVGGDHAVVVDHERVVGILTLRDAMKRLAE